MTLYGGIDLHANNSVVVVLDEQDRVVYQKRLRNELQEILQQLAPYKASLHGVVVAPPSRRLTWAGCRLHGQRDAGATSVFGLQTRSKG